MRRKGAPFLPAVRYSRLCERPVAPLAGWSYALLAVWVDRRLDPGGGLMATAKRDLTNPPVQGHDRSHDDQLLTLQQVAELLDVSPNTIYYWRYQGTGPQGHRIGKRVRYWRSETASS
jgi:predicted DNA-binding transcriptional regulator AlpA